MTSVSLRSIIPFMLGLVGVPALRSQAAKKHTSQVQADKASLLLAQQKRERKNALRLLHIVE
jgi:hypothetical protein